MTDFVLVHGAFHGGWCWSACADELRRHGARVFTPTLTGLADRSHLFSPSINLATHVQDVIQVIDFEQLDGCVLAGHSYGGNVISGVADQLRQRVSHYIFVDASVPPPDATRWRWADNGPQQFEERMQMIDGPGQGMMIPPFPAEAFGLSDPEHLAWVQSRLTPMPRDCFTEYIALRNGATEGLKRSYIAAVNPPYERNKQVVARVSKDPTWTFRTLDTGHDMMVSKPIELARLLLELV